MGKSGDKMRTEEKRREENKREIEEREEREKRKNYKRNRFITYSLSHIIYYIFFHFIILKLYTSLHFPP